MAMSILLPVRIASRACVVSLPVILPNFGIYNVSGMRPAMFGADVITERVSLHMQGQNCASWHLPHRKGGRARVGRGGGEV